MNETLLNSTSDLFTLAIKLKTSRDYGQSEILLKKIKDLFSIFEIKARGIKGIKSEDIYDTKYALAALIDEILLSSNWQEKESWSSCSLQLEYFEENIAGTEFFNKLNNLKAQINNKIEVLEIYYFCLSLGFEGKYKIEGLEKLKFLTNNLALDIKNSKNINSTPLSPNWQPSAEIIKKIGREVPIWLMSVICVFISFIFYLSFQFFINQESSKIIQMLNNIISRIS